MQPHLQFRFRPWPKLCQSLPLPTRLEKVCVGGTLLVLVCAFFGRTKRSESQLSGHQGGQGKSADTHSTGEVLPLDCGKRTFTIVDPWWAREGGPGYGDPSPPLKNVVTLSLGTGTAQLRGSRPREQTMPSVDWRHLDCVLWWGEQCGRRKTCEDHFSCGASWNMML